MSSFHITKITPHEFSYALAKLAKHATLDLCGVLLKVTTLLWKLSECVINTLSLLGDE